jgi:hypothetical protein
VIETGCGGTILVVSATPEAEAKDALRPAVKAQPGQYSKILFLKDE